jgi:tetratricopeptide (TPR) repeat protein
MSSTTTRVRLDPDELAALEEQRDFLLASLEDLEREHDAGDLDDGDYDTLKDDYTARAADVIRAIEDHREAFEEAKRPRRLGVTVAVIGGIVVFAVLAGVLVANALGARQAGETSSGGISVRETPTQKAQACLDSGSPTDLAGATKLQKCFNAVLDEDPENATALTYKAWVSSITAGLGVLPDPVAAQSQQQAEKLIDEAVTADPNLADARAFRVIINVRSGRYAEAKRYLADFDALNPPASMRQLLDQFQVRDAIEKGIADGSPSGSSTTTSTTTPG